MADSLAGNEISVEDQQILDSIGQKYDDSNIEDLAEAAAFRLNFFEAESRVRLC